MRFDFDDEISLNALLRSLQDAPPSMMAGYQVLNTERRLEIGEMEYPADILVYRLEDSAELFFCPLHKILDVVVQVNGRSDFGTNQAIHDLTAGVKILLCSRSNCSVVRTDKEPQ